MSEHAGEKTEQPTARRMEEAIKRGQFPRSPEVQTVFVLMFGLMAVAFAGQESWSFLVHSTAGVLGHLHEIPVDFNLLPGYALSGILMMGKIAGPIVLAALLGGLLAGGIQNRFQTSPEAMSPSWDRLNPVSGLQRIVSTRSLVATGLALLKLGAIIALSYTTIKDIFTDPIFYSGVDVARIAQFMAQSSMKILLRIGLILAVISALDYAYQFWQNHKKLMMTREEVKEEAKNMEGNPHVRARQRRRSRSLSQRRMMMEVPKADVIVTNPTHFAIALRYDSKTMAAPRIVAKGIRLNALRIREIAEHHQVPIMENKPLARLLFKYGKVGGEVPAQLYAAVAEVLAWVYRTNRYRYYTQANQVP